MAKIPEASFGSNKLQTQFQGLPEQSVGQAGMTNEAWARLGEQGMRFGAELLRQREESNFRAYAVQAESDYKLTYAAKERELQLKYDGKDPSGYSDEMREFHTKYNQEQIKKAKSDRQKSYWEEKGTEYSSVASIKADSYEFKSKVAYDNSQNYKFDDNASKEINLNPDRKNVLNFFTQSSFNHTMGTGISKSHEDAKKEVSTAAQKFYNAYSSGLQLMPDKITAAHQRMAFLDGKDEELKPLYDSLEADFLVKERLRAKADLEQLTEIGKAEASQRVQDVVSKLISTGEIDDREYNYAYASASKEQKPLLIEAKNLGTKLSEIKKIGDPDKMLAAAERDLVMADKSAKGFEDKNKLVEYTKLQVLKYSKEIEKTPGVYIEQFPSAKNLAIQALDPEQYPTALSQYMAEAKAIKTQAGITSPGLLPPFYLNNKKLEFKNAAKSGNGVAIEKNIQNLRLQTGDDFNQVISEIVSDEEGSGLKTEDFLITTTIQEPSVRENLHTLVRMKKSDLPKGEQYVDPVSDLRNNVKYRRYKEALADTGAYSPELINALDNLTLLQARTRAASGKSNSVDQAVNDIIGRNIITKQTNGNLIIPPSLENDRDNIESLFNNTKYMKDLIPDDKQRDNSIWRLSPNMKDYELTTVSPSGRRVPVKKNGKVVRLSPSDINTLNIKYSGSVEKNKPMWRSLREWSDSIQPGKIIENIKAINE